MVEEVLLELIQDDQERPPHVVRPLKESIGQRKVGDGRLDSTIEHGFDPFVQALEQCIPWRVAPLAKAHHHELG